MPLLYAAFHLALLYLCSVGIVVGMQRLYVPNYHIRGLISLSTRLYVSVRISPFIYQLWAGSILTRFIFNKHVFLHNCSSAELSFINVRWFITTIDRPHTLLIGDGQGKSLALPHPVAKGGGHFSHFLHE